MAQISTLKPRGGDGPLRLVAPAGGAEHAAGSVDLGRLLTILRRQWRLILAAIVLTVAAALAYILTTPPRYTASTQIVIDSRKNQLLQNQQVFAEQTLDSPAVESQVEILRSESVALSVIRELKLIEDPEFRKEQRGLLGEVAAALFGGARPMSVGEREQNAVTIFGKNLAAKRLVATYVIQVDFTSLDKARAAQIANAIADAYMVGELEARYRATRRASRWLQERITELREQARVADQAVQTFKSENDLVDTGRGLLSDQQLGDVNTQLITARAATAEAKARLDRINEIARSELPEATVTDALRNEVISRLRAQLLDLAAKEADWSARYGANHSAAVNLRNQMREIRRSIADELRRIAETYKSDYEIALTRERSLDESLSRLVSTSAVTGQAQVKLRDLESSAQTARNLYDSFLQKFLESTQQQSFPISEARVITAATEPLRPSHPKSVLTLAGAVALGLCLGASGALARERMKHGLRAPAEVEALTGLDCLGTLPMVRGAAPVRGPSLSPAAGAERAIGGDVGLARYGVEEPFSRFSEALRSIKVAIDICGLSREMRVVGLTSSVPREGKTVLAANVAGLVAHGGHRTLLIDGDLRNPSLTRLMAPAARAGLVEVLTGSAAIGDVIWTDPVTGLHVLPAVLKGSVSHTAELISSKKMGDLLARARERYDYIFIDLPPIIPVVDVRAAAHLVDGFVFAIEWGATSPEAVREALGAAPLVVENSLGSVLTKADPAALKREDQYRGSYSTGYYHEGGKAA